MGIKKLGTKISLSAAVLIILAVTILGYISTTSTEKIVTELSYNQAANANASLQHELESYKDIAKETATRISVSEGIINSILSNDIEALRENALQLGGGIEMITICDKNGIVLLRTHGTKSGDDLNSVSAISETLKTGVGIKTIEMGSTVGLSTRGSAAVKDYDGNTIGVISCGHDLSNFKYVDEVKEQLKCETTLFAGDTRMNTTIKDDKGERVLGTQASAAVIDTVINKRQDYSGQVQLFGKMYQVYYSPMIENDKVIGMYFTGLNIDNTLTSLNTITTTFITAAVISVILVVMTIILISQLMISRPLKKMKQLATELSNGNVGIRSKSAVNISSKSKDEVGQLGRTLNDTKNALNAYINEISECLSALEHGDLTRTTDFNFNGDFLLIKEAINNISKSICGVFGEINASSDMVAKGADSISDGAQQLASGSVNQAEKIGTITQEISRISIETRESSEKAREVSKTVAEVKKNAEIGTKQMDNMLGAVSEITNASNAISDVIKTIESIASQTNILALNASVEAARAGVHGKGFAIVANEVRNLATLSADAAKNTNELILNSIEKSELGAKIAQETSDSLGKIVEGVNFSTAAINEIADLSLKQSQDIDMLSGEINSVTAVVESNSATAEESAAASEELTSQSNLLHDMIANFKID